MTLKKDIRIAVSLLNNLKLKCWCAPITLNMSGLNVHYMLFIHNLWATDTFLPLVTWSLKKKSSWDLYRTMTSSHLKLNDKQNKRVHCVKFNSNNCLISPSILKPELSVSVLINWEDAAFQKVHNKALSWRVSGMQNSSCWSGRCFSNTSPLLSISLKSCPNDDPRPTFNHYLHCPF